MGRFSEEALALHRKHKGKIGTISKVPLVTRDDLSRAYTPGVAAVSQAIATDPKLAYEYTIKANTVAVISDGSAVLGLGNIGGLASLPVMEGKAAIFKAFADIDAIPIVLASQDVETTIQTIRNIAIGFGGINLEDFKAPECFTIEDALQDLGIPVMHDDQHGTAVVVLAALTNALIVANKDLHSVRIVINGVGAAGVAITKLLILAGVPAKNVVLCDTKGTIHKGRNDITGTVKEELAAISNEKQIHGTLAQALKGADVFIGVSKANLLSEQMVESMAEKAIVFAMANPDPEIVPEDAKKGGALVIATGRSDFPNQVNNSLAFPGIFKGALDARATRITPEMKLAAAEALAALVPHPTADEILPFSTDKRVTPAVATAVKHAWTT